MERTRIENSILNCKTLVPSINLQKMLAVICYGSWGFFLGKVVQQTDCTKDRVSLLYGMYNKDKILE